MKTKLFLLMFFAGASLCNTASEPEFVYPDVFNDPERDAFIYGNFPDNFAWSSATSSYQIEGGWDADGKGLNIWDTFTHEGGNVYNNGTGDVACDSYHKYRDDVELMVAMGLKYYRFSFSWARIMPDGTPNNINAPGRDYYNNLIDLLIENDITPMVTLYHWDLPQALQDQFGGWESEQIVEHFNNYAAYCYQVYGDRVRFWITFNEPWVIAVPYEDAGMAPGILGPGILPYVVAHNIIKSHARAWHTYDEQFRSTQNGKCGITLNSDFFAPHDGDDEKHVAAADMALQFMLGWFGCPVFKTGHYPEVMRTMVDGKSEIQGYNDSRLPTFTAEEADYNLGTSDFFGLNHYTSLYSEDDEPDNSMPPSYWRDQDTNNWQDPAWPKGESPWLKAVPWGIRGLLNWIDSEYGDIDIYITENGFSTADIFDLTDDDRVKYYRSYINEVLKAVSVDGVNVKGYTAWSLMDNFEWASGYRERFGMHYVDFNDPERPRTPKDSAKLYAQIVADNGFNSGQTTVASFAVILFNMVMVLTLYII